MALQTQQNGGHSFDSLEFVLSWNANQHTQILSHLALFDIERAAYPDRFDSWTKAQISPYINVVIDAFGYDRCMFGGNWFVVNLFSSYDRWAEVRL